MGAADAARQTGREKAALWQATGEGRLQEYEACSLSLADQAPVLGRSRIAAQLGNAARHLRMAVRDFSVPSREQLVATLNEIDGEIRAGGLVYVHCWAGCGRTGVVVGAWLVRHGVIPNDALARIAEARGLGCPQTLEQRLLVLDRIPGARPLPGSP